MATYVLDSSAVIAASKQEPGAEMVLHVLPGALVCSVNVTEVLTKFILDGADPDLSWEMLAGMGFEVAPYELNLARQAADLARITKPYGLSLGDRACLALALERKAIVYTADRTWKNLSLGIRVELIR